MRCGSDAHATLCFHTAAFSRAASAAACAPDFQRDYNKALSHPGPLSYVLCLYPRVQCALTMEKRASSWDSFCVELQAVLLSMATIY